MWTVVQVHGLKHAAVEDQRSPVWVTVGRDRDRIPMVFMLLFVKSDKGSEGHGISRSIEQTMISKQEGCWVVQVRIPWQQAVGKIGRDWKIRRGLDS